MQKSRTRCDVFRKTVSRFSKRLWALCLTVALVIGMIPVFPMEKVEASNVITEAEMTARVKDLAVRCGLNEDLSVSEGIFFTSTGVTCDNKNCDACNVSKNVLAEGSAFLSHFGINSVNADLLPFHYDDCEDDGDGDRLAYGASCAGFANFALWYLGRSDNTSNLHGYSAITKVAQATVNNSLLFNEANLRACDLKIGDVIRCGGHSMMFLGYESRGIRVLDNNRRPGFNRIRIGVIGYANSDWTGKNMGITRLSCHQPNASAPTITNVRAGNADATGFTITCTVTDDEGVGAVYFPVWTDANGQDDLASIWPVGTAEGNNVYSYRVNVADHNNEYGTYVIHVYARDINGAQSGPEISSFDNTNMNPRLDVTSVFPLIDGAYYNIWSHGAGKNLDMAGCTDASNAIINDITAGKASQIFKAVKHSDGYSFVSVTTGYALDMYGNSTGIGGQAKLCSYHGGVNQRFKLVDEGDGYYSIRPANSGLLLTYNGSTDAGTNVVQSNCDGSDAAKWGFAQCAIPTEFPLVNGAYYYIWNHHAGKFMDYDGTTAGSPIILKEKVENKPSQLWKAIKCEDGYTFISSETGLALDVMGGSAEEGAMICQSTYHGGANQRFKILTRGDGYYTIRSVGSDLPFSIADDAVSVVQKNHNGTNGMVWGFGQYVETIPPVISDAKIISVDGGGYTVECTVTDNVGVDRVQFPTWTDANGQDDLIEEWQTNSAITGTANENIYTFRVKDSDHNFERGRYVTHIYAFDTSGNVSQYDTEISCDLQNNGVVVAEGTYNGHTYQFIDDKMTWHEAKAACEALGGHLVTITSAEEQQAIESFLPANTDFNSAGYFIGGYAENGQSKWVTGEDFIYSNWYPGEPSGTFENVVEDVYHLYARSYDDTFTGKWNDTHSGYIGMGYICEVDPIPIEITGITLSESETEVGFNQTKTLTATVTPEGYHPPITWTSANPAIATVSDGIITGVAAGTTTITAECGGKTATCKVTVVKPFESLTMNLADKSLFKNETCMLEVSFAPADANASKELVWTSANPEVATVDEKGVVTAVSAGTTIITVALKQNPQVTATCTVQVESYVVNFDTRGGSSIAPVECGKDETLSVDEPTKSGYAFTGWYKDAECTIPWDMENDVVNGNITLYAGWMEYHEGLWIVEIPAQKYTGSAIKPKVEVYHYATKLTEGTDYKVSYKNNKNAGDKDSAKAPTVTVSGKGNYTGKETATFTISPKNIADAEVEADNVSLATNGKVQKPVPVVSWKGKKLKKDKDFTVEYPDSGAGAYQNDGVYTVRIVGKGNFHGERTVQFYLTGGNVMSKAKVSSIPAQSYTGKEITPEVTVKYGSAVLTKDVDYTVSYRNNVVAGTATMILKGMGSYGGEKKVTFKIKGTPISQTEVTLMPESVAYTGKAIAVPYELKLKDNSSVILKEGYDYTATYKNNTNVGTATITFKGINGYSGSVKKTFRITGYDIKADSAKAVTVKYSSSIGYMKGGTTMEPKVTCFGKTLKKNVDYKLTYKNNKEVYNGSDTTKMPTVIISGKGNYSGSLELNFNITTQDISLLNMTAPDKVYQSKAGKCLSVPVIKDVNGKKLTAGKDYEKNAVYTYTTDTKLADGTIRSAGSAVQASDILPAGTSVTVTAKGMGNYTGEISCTYRIVQADISKAKGKIAAQVYTGKAIEPGKSDITLKVGKTTLAPTDYEIVSYSNNVKKGTATVVVKGVGNYGGTREIKFQIKSKVFSWWWR